VTTEPLTHLVRHLRQTLDATDMAGMSDVDLLRRFRECRDPAAFEAIVLRHGSRVMAACRQVLGNEADVEDAFQAAFVVLMREPNAVRNGRALGHWLFGVAHRVALQARAARKRRERLEAKAPAKCEPRPDLSWTEACAILHEELDRLPEINRRPLLLCYLEGLTRDEAAAELGRTIGSVKKSLERGRELLRKRLKRRGVTLSAGLLAAVVQTYKAGMSSGSLRATIEWAANPAPAVVTLANAVSRGSAFTGAKVLGACLAASMLAVGIALGTPGDPRGKEMPAKKEMPGKEAAKAPGKKELTAPVVHPNLPEKFTYAGDVTDANAKPVKGAKLWLYLPGPGGAPLRMCGESDADGKFTFEVKRTDLPAGFFQRRPGSWEGGIVVATAPGFGVAWSPRTAAVNRGIDLRLPTDDVPVEGRVFTLEGKPVAGARVSVIGLYRPQAADLGKWHADLKAQRHSRHLLQNHMTSGMEDYELRHGQLNAAVPPVTTAADGKFTLTGLGRERLAVVRIEGELIESRDVFVMTRPGEALTVTQWKEEDPEFQLPRHTYYGCKFDHAAAPSRPVVGGVRDADTGKPIPGARVALEHVAGNIQWDPLRAHTRTDRDGRFKLIGMPLKDGNHVVARGPADEPYVAAYREVSIPGGLGPIEVDFKLKRGVWVTGRVVDRDANTPVQAEVHYFALTDNPHLKDFPGFRRTDLHSRTDDGSFRLAVLPGPGVVALQLHGDHSFVAGDAQSDKSPDVLPAKPFDFRRREFLAHVRIDPAADSTGVTCDFGLTAGTTATGRVVGQDGKTARDVVIAGEWAGSYFQWAHRNVGEFKATGFRPGKPRYIQAIDEKNQRAGAVLVTGEDKGPVELKLEPWGVLTGRVVDEGGEPMANVSLTFTWDISPDENVRRKAGMSPLGNFQTDKDGRFRIPGLVPGMTYTVVNVRASVIRGAVARDVSVKSGETKDLGEVRLR